MSEKRRVVLFIERFLSSLRKSQRGTIGDLTFGLMNTGRLGLAGMARGMRDGTTVRHRIKRIWRFARNERVDLRLVFGALSDWCAAGGEGLVVALDWTELTRGYQLLAAKVALRKRAIPLAWRVVRKEEFNDRQRSRNQIEEELILQLRRLLWGKQWVLVADRGFARAALFQKLSDWGISYVIRCAGNVWIRKRGFSGTLDHFPRRANRTVRYKEVFYQQRLQVPVGLVVSHREPAFEPWYLITNVEGEGLIEQIYRKRMWIEESFRDAKSNLGLSKLWLSDPRRMQRLLVIAAVAMLLAVIIALDYQNRHPGKDPQLTTKRQGPTMSVFRRGLELFRLQGPPTGLQFMKLHTLILQP